MDDSPAKTPTWQSIKRSMSSESSLKKNHGSKDADEEVYKHVRKAQKETTRKSQMVQ